MLAFFVLRYLSPWNSIYSYKAASPPGRGGRRPGWVSCNVTCGVHPPCLPPSSGIHPAEAGFLCSTLSFIGNSKSPPGRGGRRPGWVFLAMLLVEYTHPVCRLRQASTPPRRDFCVLRFHYLAIANPLQGGVATGRGGFFLQCYLRCIPTPFAVYVRHPPHRGGDIRVLCIHLLAIANPLQRGLAIGRGRFLTMLLMAFTHPICRLHQASTPPGRRFFIAFRKLLF